MTCYCHAFCLWFLFIYKITIFIQTNSMSRTLPMLKILVRWLLINKICNFQWWIGFARQKREKIVLKSLDSFRHTQRHGLYSCWKYLLDGFKSIILPSLIKSSFFQAETCKKVLKSLYSFRHTHRHGLQPCWKY